MLCVLLPAVAPARVAQAQQAAGARPVVVLDAAHGGDDVGAGLGSQPEKNLTLALSVKLRSLLAARGFTVVTTRENDTAVDADQRAEIADHAGALACLSIHATQAGSGVHLFVSSLAPVETAHMLAWKTAQAAWVAHSLSLAGVINSAFGQAGMTVTLGRTDLPGVDSMTCPAVVIEVAPQKSTDGSAKANPDDATVQAHVAEALAAAMVEWRAETRNGGQR